MTLGDVRGAILSSCHCSVKDEEVLVFADEEKPVKGRAASRRTAFDMMLGQLKKGSVVIVWSWQCLINRGRPEWAAFDVLDALRKIHEHECSVSFVHESVSTSTAAGRYLLNQLIFAAQYNYDFALEREKVAAAKSKSSCCSGSSSTASVSVVEVSSKTATGC